MTEKAGCGIVRIYFATNDSAPGNDVRLEELTLSGWGIEKSWGNPTSETSDDYYAYYYNPSDYKEVSNAIMVYRGINKADAMYATLNVRCTMESGDIISVTIYLDIVDTDGAVTTLSDEVVLSA